MMMCFINAGADADATTHVGAHPRPLEGGGEMLTPFVCTFLFLVLKNSSIMQHIWTFNIFFHWTDSFIDLSFFLVCIALLPPGRQVSKRIEETYCLTYKQAKRQIYSHLVKK